VALRGTFQELSAPDLLQTLNFAQRTGILTVTGGPDKEEAFIYWREGQMVHASAGRREGAEVVYDLIGRREGEFSFEPMEVDCAETITLSTENLMLEAARVFDEGAKFAGSVPEEGAALPVPATTHELLTQLIEVGGSDLHLNVGVPPYMRVHGELTPVDLPPLNPETVQHLACSLLTRDEVRAFEQDLELDTSYTLPGVGRFRVNVLRQRGYTSVAVRAIPFELIPFEQLGLPASVETALNEPNGLILVAGAAGSGKSTTLAAMIDKLNREQALNIITLEDPIEFIHKQKRCVIRQRQVGVDTESFARGLKYALRQDPDVVLVGEMRDRETMEGALSSAETGQLVLGTLHTNDAVQSINRVIDMFPADQQHQIRSVLSMVVRAVIVQQLVPRADGQGRVLAAEVLVANPAIQSMIRDNRVFQIYSQMETGMREGMQTMNSHLAQLVTEGVVEYEQALARSPDAEGLAALLGTRG